MDLRRGLGLLGIIFAAFAAQLNDLVVSTALPDITGGLGIGRDAASWLPTLFVTGEAIGMCSAPSLGIGFSVRRFALFAVAVNCVPTLLMALGGGAPPILILRFIQGLGAGFTIPLLMIIALRVLDPAVRLYGLAIYAMTATLTPNLAAAFAALWTDGVGDWHLIFLQPIPFCVLAALGIWWGLDQEPPRYDRLRKFDWVGVLLVIAGFGSLSIVLEQGDRLDWFNSPLISILTLTSVVAIPLFFVVEQYREVPLIRLDLMKRRNFAYAVLTLLVFLVVALSATAVPLNFLEQVNGYRPLQAYPLTVEIAATQIVFLPATAWLLDHRHVDARWVNAIGFLCILLACIDGAHVTSNWVRDQFYLFELLQSVGFAFVVMPVLMIATNSITPQEGPFGSALVNTPRAIAEAAGVWTLQLITRWRGGLHRDRIIDLVGQNRFVLGEVGLPGATPPAGALGALDREIERQVTTLTTIDTFIILGLTVIALMVALAFMPQRTYPPRIALAGQ